MHQKVRLFIQMLIKGALGLAMLALLLFGSAGTFGYPNAWVLLITLAVLMLALGMILLCKFPETLARRLKAKEGEKVQRWSIALMGILFVLSFLLAGFDFRFDWSQVSYWGERVALVVMMIGYCLFAIVIFQNTYASRVVEVQQGQKVISTGLYAVVRHPMYLACLLLFLSMPFVLGSYIAAVPMLFFPCMLVLRIKNEEAVLQEGLEGYSEYTKKTKYRLFPFVW